MLIARSGIQRTHLRIMMMMIVVVVATAAAACFLSWMFWAGDRML